MTRPVPGDLLVHGEDMMLCLSTSEVYRRPCTCIHCRQANLTKDMTTACYVAEGTPDSLFYKATFLCSHDEQRGKIWIMSGDRFGIEQFDHWTLINNQSSDESDFAGQSL